MWWSLTWMLLQLYRCKAWPELVTSAGRHTWWVKLRQFWFWDWYSFLEIARMWHLAVQFGQCQTESKLGIQTYIAGAVTPVWKMKHYCLDMAESGRNFTQAFHTCSLKDAGGITCVFHDTCTSQSRLLLFLFGERTLQHLNLLLWFCSMVETVVPSGHRWIWSNKQRLVSQLWKKPWCEPEDLAALGHAMWLFLLRRKPKTILKEPSWCHRALRRNRDIYTSSELWGVSSVQNLSVRFCFNFVLKKQWSGEPQKSLVKDKRAVQKGHNSKYNPQLLYSLSFWKSFWATAEVDWSQCKDGCRLPQPLVCNVWRGSGLN